MKLLPLLTLTFIILCLSFAPYNSNAQQSMLGLVEAETLALENDPMLNSFAERRRAMQEAAIADAQLPDPTIKLGAMNMPVNSFSRHQEPMTQLQLGISQRFPRGDTLRLRGERGNSRASVETQKQDARLAMTLLEVRTAWLDVYYWQNAIGILNEQHNALDELFGVIQYQYAEGRGQQQDVLRAELELNLLKDKVIDTERRHENAVAVLGRWVGQDQKQRPLGPIIPEITEPVSYEMLGELLLEHPVVNVHDAEILVSKNNIDIARQAYKPAWGVDVGYGSRASDFEGVDRADFVSVMVSLDIPIFTGKRQDRRVSSARHQEAALRLTRDDKIRQLEQMLDEAWADWQRSAERLDLYSDRILSSSEDTYTVTLNAYQNEVTDFALLIRARLLDFDTRLRALNLFTEHKKAQVRLLYLQGEEK